MRFIEDSDQSENADEVDTQDKDYINLKKKVTYENIPLIQDAQGFIYYLIHKDGQILILEGNPKDPYEKNHFCIFELKVL